VLYRKDPRAQKPRGSFRVRETCRVRLVSPLTKRTFKRPSGVVPETLSRADELLALMTDRYNVKNLVNVDRLQFKADIDAFLAMEDASMEGYASPELQRDKSIRFYWPYTHDFGDFKVGPPNKYRPSRLIARFMEHFGVPARDLTGKTVLDIGCYLGGPALLLAAMGAKVVAIEEVAKYVDCLKYIRDAFDLENLEPRRLSLYDLTADEFQDAFDIVLFAGVLYHLSDPVLGMRITFDALKPGGTVLLETGAMRSEERVIEYAGREQQSGTNGANWFFPSPVVVTGMMGEVGYTDVRQVVRHLPHRRRDRMVAIGTKVEQVDMLRAGLSVPNVR
jgi:2-polyprenyl-3-methyl-5-hydroxy-6-metoxy-1,4-benzoquinol methylase